MNKISAVIIDDVPTAIENLKQLLADFVDEIKVIGEADRVVSGAKLIQQLDPEIAFLDIEMPDGTGFDLIDLLPDTSQTRIIFTTGSENYAIKAFRYAAVDYLLKPIDPDDLANAIQKAKSISVTVGIVQQVLHKKNNDGLPSRIALHTAEEIMVADIEDIVRCQSMDNYCQIYFSSGNKILMSKPLKYYAELLEPANFIRVHQSHLVNVEFIHSFVKKEGGYLLLKDDTQIPVSVRKRAELMERIS